jgi:hypothetical protein
MATISNAVACCNSFIPSCFAARASMKCDHAVQFIAAPEFIQQAAVHGSSRV